MSLKYFSVNFGLVVFIRDECLMIVDNNLFYYLDDVFQKDKKNINLKPQL